MKTANHDASPLLIELGAAIVGLAILARLAQRFGFSAIPLYLLAGLAFGRGGLAPLSISQGFIATGAEIGVLLLLFLLGLEHTGEELAQSLKTGTFAGIVDFVLNFVPGLAAGFLFKWQLLPSVLLGGITWVSSSGVIAKVLSELKWMSNPETPAIISILVFEDLAMAVFLPIVAVLLSGETGTNIVAPVLIAIGAVTVILFAALRYGRELSRIVTHPSDEVMSLTMFGAVLLVAGLAQRLQVSSAIGAFLVGIALSGSVAERSYRLLRPMRDLFAATFFFFFGLETDPSQLPAALPIALLLALLTAGTKILTGYLAARRSGIDRRGRMRAGLMLIARGEFSIVLAGLGTSVEPRLAPLAAAYVLLTVVVGPVVARFAG